MFMSDISIIVRKMRIHAERSQAQLGIGFPEQLVLMHLKGFGPSNQESIAASLDIDKGAIAKTVAKLEEKKLVIRAVNPANKREKLVELQPAAEELLTLMAQSYREFEAIMFDGLTQEQVTAMASCIAQVAANVSKNE